ncbi:hypothetical protein KMT30_16650 [Streptomyces sp. IBSBF 2953]|nr:hypothetical protein [Streptomyces hayashii]
MFSGQVFVEHLVFARPGVRGGPGAPGDPHDGRRDGPDRTVEPACAIAAFGPDADRPARATL